MNFAKKIVVLLLFLFALTPAHLHLNSTLNDYGYPLSIPEVQAQEIDTDNLNGGSRAISGMLVIAVFLSMIALKIILILSAYERGCLWVLLVLLIPYGEIIYIITMEKDDRNPMLLWYVGNIVAMIAAALIPF